MQDCIQGLLFLLHNPNLTDPLSPYFDAFYDEEEFAKNVRKSLLGEEVEGATFDSRESLPATDTTTKHKEEDTVTLEGIFADICAVIDSVEGATIQRTTAANTTPWAIGNITVGEEERFDNNSGDENTNLNVVMSSCMESNHTTNLTSRRRSACDNVNLSTPHVSGGRPILSDKDAGMEQPDSVRQCQRLICVRQRGYQCVMRVLCEPFKLLIVAAKNVRNLYFRLNRRAGKKKTIC